MTGQWGEWRKFNADGLHGADALARGLEAMVTGIASGPDTKRGINARLRYLTASKAGREAMAAQGISRRALAAWTAGKRSPSPKSRAALDRAYWGLRRQRVVAHIKRRLAREGRGTRIEIDPVDQSRVLPGRRRDLNVRRITIRPATWTAAVDAWAEGDTTGLQAVWDDVMADLGSDGEAYEYVSSVGWNA
ncbi:transcriptional regulator [Streptomyces alkaliphilus]|uniref:Transcriptional regulator n=1 Tax=Streptomyces alkaliphilus TaxID=1472722 RepID=A0A7W3TFR9_9ACTN|nr:transcriptional regulator [Streptomyces alkaliphilus]MBB0245870.1 transcriptional regulator [Streptomyces alkaliphilus]